MSEQAELKKFLATLSKTQGAVISQIKDMERPEIEALPSGSYTIDRALGVGGYPRGRVIEIYGAEASGKTTLTLLAIAETQKNGGTCAFIDVEHALTMSWAEKLGVNVGNLIFTQPDSAEQALSIVEELVASNMVDLIVIDSVAGLVTKAEIEGEMGDQFMGVQARFLSQALKKLTPVVGKSKATVIFINQIRQKIGVMYGNPNTTPGGLALKFYSSVRLAVKKVPQSDIKDAHGAYVGHRLQMDVIKNKVGAPHTTAEFSLNFLTGVDRIDELVTLGILNGIIEQSGPMYKFGDLSAKGVDKLIETVRADKKLQDAIWKAIKEKK
jgi:recombination protein RecA